MTPLDAQRLILGAAIRGTLTPRDLRDLAPGWWRLPPADGAPRILDRSPSRLIRGRDGGAYHVALAELHGEILAAWQASCERRGLGRLDDVGVLLGADARRYAVGLAKGAPKRGVALMALDVIGWHAATLADADAGARRMVRDVAGAVARGVGEGGPHATLRAGLMMVSALGGVMPDV